MELLIALAALGAYLYYQQSQDFLQQYHISFLNASFNLAKTESALYTNIYFNVNIDISNTTAFSGTLQSAVLTITLQSNGANLGYINLPSPVTIVPNGHTKVSIPVSIPTGSIISDIQSLVQMISDGQQIVLHISGKLVFTIGTVTIDEDYPITLG